MIKTKGRPKVKIATGHYINAYGKDGVDLFVIIHEANTCDDSTILRATAWLEDVLEINNVNDIDNGELELLLEKFFPYGVSVYRR